MDGINVGSPFGEYTLSETESKKNKVLPSEVATFQQESFRGLPAFERDSMIREVVSTIGLDAADLPSKMLEFGVTPQEIASATGFSLAQLPQSIQGVADFPTRKIGGFTPATFVPPVKDIPDGGLSGLPSLATTTLPSYTPINFTATPEEVAQSTITAMNAAKAVSS